MEKVYKNINRDYWEIRYKIINFRRSKSFDYIEYIKLNWIIKQNEHQFNAKRLNINQLI